MIKHRGQYLFLLAALISIYFTACDEVKNPCLLPKTAPIGIGTYRTVETDTGFVIRDTSLPGITIAALDSPFAFVYKSVAISKFKLLLSPLVDSTKVLIKPDTVNITVDGLDTVTFYYQRKLHFLSNACGYTHFFDLIDVKTTNHCIDSVRIVKTGITNAADVEHVKVYY